MAPQDSGLWTYAMHLKELCPLKFNSTREGYARLQEVKVILANKGADFMALCGQQHGEDCGLLRQLSGLNDVLTAIQVQVKERVATEELEVWFPVMRSGHRQTRSRIERAIVLLHWLLVKHACVTAIELDDLGHLGDSAWFALFCDGISECRRMTTFRVNVRREIHYQQLLTACGFLQRLEEFTFASICADQQAENVVALQAVIENNMKLRRFEVGQLVAPPRDLSPILRALAISPNISRLSLDMSYLNPEDASLFLQVLKGNNLLKSLSVHGRVWHKHLTVSSIASALEDAKALVELELVRFRVPTPDARALAASLIGGQTVQRLDLLGCMPVFSFSHSASYAGAEALRGPIGPYIHILQELPSLRELSLDLLEFPPEDQRAFFKALAGNRYLHHVLVTPPYRPYSSELARIAQEAGTASRIHGSLVTTDVAGFVDIPRGLPIHELNVGPWTGTCIDESTILTKCFADVRKLDNVTKLTLNIAGDIELDSAKRLGLYLKTTKCLKEATLSFSADKESSMLLLDSIARNSSIISLGVEHWCHRRRSAVLLADVVCSSRIIHTLTYTQDSTIPTKAFFSRLCESIRSNFTIVSVNTSALYAKSWPRILEATTRNAAILKRAARVVAGLCCGKTEAATLESVASSPLLLPRVQEVMSVCESEAAKMLRATLTDLKELDVFMSIAGVVREGVVCEESSDGRPRLDTLPLECWLAIRRYLSFADVASTGPERR